LAKSQKKANPAADVAFLMRPTLGGKQRYQMAYQFEFFQRTRDIPAGKTVRRHAADFSNLQAARAFGISEVSRDTISEIDGCRIYCDGVYQSTVSVHSEAGVAERP
jgi:hypothetical protein